MTYKKIVIVANDAAGLYLFREMLIRKLIGEGSSITALIPFGSYVAELQKLGVKTIITPIDRRGINPFKDLGLIMQYLKYIDQEKPALVITYTIKPNIYAGLVCRIKGIRYVENITGLGTAFESKGILRSIVKKMYKASLKKVHKVFFENSEDRSVFIRNRIIDKKKTKVLNGAGVDLNKFPYVPYPNNEIFSFLFMGRVMREKGVDELFQSMRALIAAGDKCELHILGAYEENYKEIIEEYETEGWLKFHGFQKDVRPFISACDCFVLPSYHEGMANTNLECAASGRPIITSNIHGCKEAVEKGVSGYLCTPQSDKSLRDAMEKMLNTSIEDRTLMGKAGRRHMEEVFDKEKVVAKTMACL